MHPREKYRQAVEQINKEVAAMIKRALKIAFVVSLTVSALMYFILFD